MADTPRDLVETLRGRLSAAPGFVRRTSKHAAQSRFGWRHPRRIGFVLGCQRSGTKMVMRVLDQSPYTRIYHENHASAFSGFELRSDSVVRALVATSPAPVHVFKPICDSHRADELLAAFPEARAVWIWRDANDVANSAVAKWGDHQKTLIDAIHAGDATAWGWRTAGLTSEMVDAVRRVWRPDLSPAEGALLFWVLRNGMFFARGLDRDPRTALVAYERVVEDPEGSFPALFDHLGVPFDAAALEGVRASSVRRRVPPEASSEIRALVEELTARLEAWVAPPAVLPSPLVIVIDTLGIGGAERYVVTVANWFAAQGVAVTVVSTGGDLVAALAPSVRHVEAPVDDVRVSLPIAARAVGRVLAEVQPAAIVTNSVATALMARLARDPRTPIVDVAHGWPADRYRSVAAGLRLVDRVVAVSSEVRERLVGAGFPAARVRVVHNGVETGPLGPRSGAVREAAREVLGAGPDDLLVLAVGRVVPQKAHQHVVSIAKRLRATHPRLRFAIVGTGPRSDELTAMARAAGVADVVRLVGLRSDVPDLLGSADVYLNCSDWEGMPLTTIEAMASGLPIVATRTEGSAMLLHGCGRVVAPGDDAAMAVAIAALADAPDERQRLGEAARTRALASFSHDRMARGLARVLGSLS